MAKTKREIKKFSTRMVLFVPVCIGLVGLLVFSIGSYWVEIVKKLEENKNLENKLTLLKEKEAALRVDVLKLEDPEYIARYAREKYLLTKEGEYVLKFPE